MQAYLAEKGAWLAQHPTVRPAEYHKARKQKTPRPKVLKEQAFYMPRERRDLAGTIIAEKANWTNKEIIVWLDNKEKKEQDEYNRLKLEFVRNGNRHTENRSGDIQARIEQEHVQDSERYILQNAIFFSMKPYRVHINSRQNYSAGECKYNAGAFWWGAFCAD